jgi:hypothetical protein
VNGVRFTAAAGATVDVDGNPNATEADLRDGMQGKVKGQINADGLTGSFTKVHAEPEARGTLLSIGGVDDFLVNGQRVVVDDSTKLEARDAAGAFTAVTFADLADLSEVEVHGARDDQGFIRATRVERRAVDALDEVKGRVAPPITATTFQLVSGTSPAITVDFTGATFSPAGTTVSNLGIDVLVEVHGGLTAFDALTNVFTATKIDFEDAEDAEFEAAEGQKFEVEGLVSGFTATPGTFNVGDMSVRTAANTKFRGGIAADLADNVRVEAEGRKVGGILEAESIKFRDNVRVEADVTAVALDLTTVTVLGKTVKIPSSAEINGIIAVGSGVRIRGFAVGSTITATRIDVTGVGQPGAGNNIIQGPVSAVTGTTGMTMLDLTVDTSAAGMVFRNIDDAVTSAASFFAGIKTVPPSTIVKVKGSFAGTTLTASEAEIEDPN